MPPLKPNPEAKPKSPPKPKAGPRLRQPRTTPDPPAPPRRSVLMIGSEATPFSKTGGLADVLGALPQALARLGWDVTLVVPRYRESHVGELIDRFDLRVGG